MNSMERFNSLLRKSIKTIETQDQIIITLPPLSSEEISQINAFADEHKSFFSLEARNNEGDKYVLPEFNTSLNDIPLSLQVMKKQRHYSVVFFTTEGLFSSLKSDIVQKSSRVFLFFEFPEFSSRRCKFQTWSPSDEDISPNENLTDPRKFIRDSTGGGLIEYLEFWVLKSPPRINHDFYQKWLEAAAPYTSFIFCSEIWKKESSLNLVFTGPQKLEIPYTANNKTPLSANLKIMEAANWILDIEREVDIRHNFLSSRIASERFRKTESWLDLLNRIISRAFENAKNDYKAHLHSKSSETLKAIADLRKSIAEETSKIIERTHTLTSTLFRDIAIAIGTVSIKILTAKDGDTISTLLLLFSAAWLGASLFITTKTNHAYIISLIKSRYLWSKKVNSLIPISEFKELSARPFREAISAYNKSRTYATIIYTSTIAFMLLLATSQSQLIRKILELF